VKRFPCLSRFSFLKLSQEKAMEVSLKTEQRRSHSAVSSVRPWMRRAEGYRGICNLKPCLDVPVKPRRPPSLPLICEVFPNHSSFSVLRVTSMASAIHFKNLNRYLWLLFVPILVFGACARHVPPSRILSLPETERVKGSKPYVVNGVRYYPLPDAYGFVQYGKASWYGKKFHGRPTSSGQIYNMYRKTAAHKLLPLDTMVKVTNLTNQKTVILPINDRGPFVKGRIIDLSYGAAKDLDMIGPGVVDVKVEALAREVGSVKGRDGFTPLIEVQDFRHGQFTIQVGAFENQQNALKLAERLRGSIDQVSVTVFEDENGKIFHRVQVSRCETLDQAEAMEKKLEAMGYADAFKVRMEDPR
jgi:rare lipoprotein A